MPLISPRSSNGVVPCNFLRDFLPSRQRLIPPTTLLRRCFVVNLINPYSLTRMTVARRACERRVSGAEKERSWLKSRISGAVIEIRSEKTSGAQSGVAERERSGERKSQKYVLTRSGRTVFCTAPFRSHALVARPSLCSHSHTCSETAV